MIWEAEEVKMILLRGHFGHANMFDDGVSGEMDGRPILNKKVTSWAGLKHFEVEGA